MDPTGEQEPHVVTQLQSRYAARMSPLDVPEVVSGVDVVSDDAIPRR
jgi:hypothetical protein